MTTNNHTPYTYGMSATSSNFNSPLGELDDAIGKHNLVASTDPGVNNDSSQGYEQGKSRWFNTSSNTLFICNDDTVGAAVWSEIPTPTSSIDHGGLSGLADDDHTQYHNDTRGDARYYTETELDAGQLDSRYYTETELDAGQLDNRYFRENEHIDVSAGAGDAAKPIKLDSGGHVDATMINDADIAHNSISGLTTGDPHTQYTLRSDLTTKGDIYARSSSLVTRLPVGTDGQVLSADSTETTGLKWIAQVSPGSGIPASTVDAKGDLLVASADDTVTRLAVGTNDRLLVADSGESVGVKWGTLATLYTDSDATAQAVIVDSAGHVTKPLNCAFYAYASASQLNVTGDGETATISLDSELYDTNADFNPAAGQYKFVAPKSGVYAFTMSVSLTGIGTTQNYGFIVFTVTGTSARTFYGPQANPQYIKDGGGSSRLSFSVQTYMTATDEAQLKVELGDYPGASGVTEVDTVSGAGATFLSGFLVG